MNYSEMLKSPLWQKRRLEIMERDKWKCCLCNTDDKQLHVHHTYYDSELNLWDYDDESMVTVCLDCHKNIHKELNKIFGIIAFEMIKNSKLLIEIGILIGKHNFMEGNHPAYKYYTPKD